VTVYAVKYNYRLFVTVKGYFGLGNQTSKSETVALISGKVPFVLRPVGGGDDDGTSSFDNLFWLVGDCYLCGIWKAKLCITPPARARGVRCIAVPLSTSPIKVSAELKARGWGQKRSNYGRGFGGAAKIPSEGKRPLPARSGKYSGIFSLSCGLLSGQVNPDQVGDRNLNWGNKDLMSHYPGYLGRLRHFSQA